MIADLSLNPTHVRTHESRRAFEGCTLRSALQRVHCEDRLLVCFASAVPLSKGPFRCQRPTEFKLYADSEEPTAWQPAVELEVPRVLPSEAMLTCHLGT